MLFAVVGEFFSSSASGYSKGLTLLLLGQKNKEKPIKVTPWNQYQLVDPDPQLPSRINSPIRRCASFGCFGCTAVELESPSFLIVGPTQNKEVLPSLTIDERNNSKNSDGCIVVDEHDIRRNIVSLKCSLKKAGNSATVASDGSNGGGKDNAHETLCEENDDVAFPKERRKVQWIDTIGRELSEIREFEMSEDGSDSGFDHGDGKTCSCKIM